MDQRLLTWLLALPGEYALILSIAVVSLLGMVIGPLRRALMLIPVRVAHGQVYRLLTAGWVHANLAHLFFNMLALHFFAGQTMQVVGVTRFLVLYVTAVVVAFIPTTIRHRRNPVYASLGASGGVAAVMIAAILLHPRLQIRVPFLGEPVRGGVLALGYMAYSFLHSYSESDNINHDAHLSGAVYGALLAWVFEPARVERSLRGLF